MNKWIFPKALVHAARMFKDNPQVVGEVLIALVAQNDNVPIKRAGKLSELQAYILGECADEMRELEEVRKGWADAKRKARAGKEGE